VCIRAFDILNSKVVGKSERLLRVLTNLFLKCVVFPFMEFNSEFLKYLFCFIHLNYTMSTQEHAGFHLHILLFVLSEISFSFTCPFDGWIVL
jgi:hypothetical protein